MQDPFYSVPNISKGSGFDTFKSSIWLEISHSQIYLSLSLASVISLQPSQHKLLKSLNYSQSTVSVILEYLSYGVGMAEGEWVVCILFCLYCAAYGSLNVLLCSACCPLCFIMLHVALGTPLKMWCCISRGSPLKKIPIQISEHDKYLTINTIKNWRKLKTVYFHPNSMALPTVQSNGRRAKENRRAGFLLSSAEWNPPLV